MKRVLDFIMALLATIILSPVLLVVALAILITDGSPIIYKQKRIGKDAKPFTIYKFRTMKNGTRLASTKDLDEVSDQVTVCGRLLRKTSLDELPQFINIIKGDMSFVGPRPLIEKEGEIHALRKQAGVYAVRPGLTGLAQVNGRDNISDEEKVKFDKEYVDNLSIRADIRIIIKTVFKVLGMNDIKDC